MKKLCDRVLEKIKEENISPKPQWMFFLRDCFIWTAFFISVAIGSLAFCVVLAVSLNNDWDIYGKLGRTPFQHVVLSLPYLWMILLVLFLWLSYFNYKHTKHGYKYHAFTVFGLSIVASIVLGSVFAAAKLGTKIDQMLDRNFPNLRLVNCCQNKEDTWSLPEKGLLGGKIIETTDDRDFRLEDFSGFVWEVRENDDTIEFEPVHIIPGEKVKLIGEKEDENVFWAKEIRPWEGKGSGRQMRLRLDD